MSPTAQHPVLQAPLAHAALAALAVAPLVLPVPTNANIVITAVLTVRQAKESLSLKCGGAVLPLVARLSCLCSRSTRSIRSLPRASTAPRCLWAAGAPSSRSRLQRR